MKKLIFTIVGLIGLFIACESQAAISYINGSHLSSAGSTSTTPSEPASCVEDDFIIAVAMWQDDDSSGGTITDPADFTQLDNFAETLGPDGIYYLGHKVRGSDAGNGYAFSTSSGSDNNHVDLLCFRGVDTTTPLDVTYVKATHYQVRQNDATGAAKAITTSTDNAVVVLLQSARSGSLSNGNGAPPTNYTEALDAELGVSADGFYSAFRTITSFGLETPGSFNHTDTNNNVDMGIFTIALKEAATTAISAAVRRRVSP